MVTDKSRKVQSKGLTSLKLGLRLGGAAAMAMLLSACASPTIIQPITKHDKRALAITDLQSFGIPVINRGNQMDVLIPNALLFQPSSTNYAPTAKPILVDLYQVVRTYDLSTLQIRGLTTSDMTHNGHLLAQARAAGVADQLWLNGLHRTVPLVYGALQSKHPALTSITRDVHAPDIWVHWRYYQTPRKYD
jgi:outer membrane protein OmpA-like peptidoglycan-associated protein